MLETFRKHHYVLMCLVAVVVVISFTFFFNPNQPGGGQGGSGAVVTKLFGTNLTQGDVELIGQQQRVAGQIAGGEKDSVRDFVMTMHSIVDQTRSMDTRVADVDYPTNVTIMRLECARLGIAVEKEDITNRIQKLEAFQTNGGFDSSKLETFLTNGVHGDRSATEGKLTSVVRDVILFERLTQLVGGSYAPSAQEVEADYARDHETVTVVTALLQKKDFENQTITDEDIQKFYDAEKAKYGSTEKDTAPDPLILTEEKRTVKYCITEAPKFTETPPQPPQAVPPLGAKPDFSTLPEDQKKVKEEEWKKQEDDHKVRQEAYTKALGDYSARQADYAKRQKENADAKQAWLKKVAQFCSDIVSDERGGATFESLVKPLEPPAPPAPVPAVAPVPAPPVVPTPPDNGAAPAPVVPTPPDNGAAPAPVVPTPPDNGAAPAPVVPTPPDNGAAPAPAEGNGAVKGAQGPAGAEGQPSPAAAPTPVAPPAETAPAPADATEVTPAGTDPQPPPPAPPVITAPPAPPTPPAPLPFLRTLSFTPSTAPPEINSFAGREGTATKIIFQAPEGGTETFIESNDKNSYLLFLVTAVEKPAVRPLEEIKQKISDKLKAEKVTAALKAAADDARPKILEALKAGKSFREAAEANKALVTELPPFSSKTPLPAGTANAAVITTSAGISSKETGEATTAGLQPGEVSDPLTVPEGLLLVHVVKKELQKFPDAADKKKELLAKRTFSNVGASLVPPQWDQKLGMEAYMAARTEYDAAMGYFRQRFGDTTNPVFKAWFVARRNEAMQATP